MLNILMKEVYYFLKRIVDSYGYMRFIKKSRICVKGTQETINYILNNRVSVSRFGDGEYRVMNHSGNGFQEPDNMLALRLKEVLNSNLSNHIICLPYAYVSVKHMTADARGFWYPFCGSYKDFILKITNPDKIYYDTNFTRFYMDMKDKKRVDEIVLRLKKIWDQRDLFIIEGEFSRLGVGNDLFDNARSIKRIIAPSKNAFEKYDQILTVAINVIPKDALILCALGMTATVLCYDLARKGFQAIDIGHIDVEYSWYRMGAIKKCPVPGKAVNEINAYPANRDCSDDSYKQAIIAKI